MILGVIFLKQQLEGFCNNSDSAPTNAMTSTLLLPLTITKCHRSPISESLQAPQIEDQRSQ